jgi:hypothetical protein
MKPAKSIPATASSGASRPLVLAAIFFILGAGLTGAWFHYHKSSRNADELSEPARNALEHLAVPVTIRFYSLLPAGSASAEERAFSKRVESLLAAVQAASADKIQLTRLDATVETNVAAASADGIQPFNLDKGDACFLGLVIAGGKNRETFARLQPEWEPALEYDLVRAIARVAATAAPAKPAPEIAKPSTETIAAINRLIPDVNAVSTEQAGQIFSAEYLKQCGEVGAEMEAQVNAAAQQVVQAQTSGSPTDLEAAQKKLALAQVAQGQKLRGLAAQLQAQLAVFQQMKAAATNGVK